MIQNRFNQALLKLHEDLHKKKVVDEDSKEILGKLRDDIETILNQEKGATKEQSDNLIDRLKKSANHFEASHPEITAVINDVVTILVNIGV
jgi:Domain of unknown function (DUF4404)